MGPYDRAAFRALRAALGMNETEGSRHLVRAYQDAPPVNPGPGMNVCYYQIVTEAQGKGYSETAVEGNVPCVFEFFPGRLVMVFYGPDCERWARRCMEFLFLDGKGMPRQILREAGIFPVPNGYGASVVYEDSGKVWRKRADLVVPVRVRVNEEDGSVLSGKSMEIGSVNEVPTIVFG